MFSFHPQSVSGEGQVSILHRTMTKIQPNAPRLLALATAVVGMLWGIGSGMQITKSVGNTSRKQADSNFALVILLYLFAGVEFVVAVIALINKPVVARALKYIVPFGAVQFISIQMARTVLHWALRTDAIDRCLKNSRETDVAMYLCYDVWSQETGEVIVRIINSVIIAAVFSYLALAYRRQLLVSAPYTDKAELRSLSEWESREDDRSKANDIERVQEQAWSEARANGPTAHLTGPAPGAN